MTKAYLNFNLGSRKAWLSILENCLRHLGYDDPETQKVSWILEREEILSQLRKVCDDFGDNDWPEDSHLGDVIEKHLARHLHSV